MFALPFSCGEQLACCASHLFLKTPLVAHTLLFALHHVPFQPDAHVHTYAFSKSVHVEPFWQGDDKQSFS